VVAVDQGGYVEVCSSDFAFLLPPYPSAFAEKISLPEEQSRSRPALGCRRQGGRGAITWKRTAEELEALLLETCNASGAPARDIACERRSGPLVGAQYYAWYGEGFGADH